MSNETQPFDNAKVARGFIVLECDGTRWLVHGTSRYAGSPRYGPRTPGLAVRPIQGGRARVLACQRFTHMIEEKV